MKIFLTAAYKCRECGNRFLYGSEYQVVASDCAPSMWRVKNGDRVGQLIEVAEDLSKKPVLHQCSEYGALAFLGVADFVGFDLASGHSPETDPS